MYLSLYACFFVVIFFFYACGPAVCHLPDSATLLENFKTDFSLKLSCGTFFFIWKDVFDLENIKTLPYFLCIWAKLEVGSKMGYLLVSGRDVYQQTEGSVDSRGLRVRAKCISPNFVLHFVIQLGMTEGYGNLRPWFKIESILYWKISLCMCVLHTWVHVCIHAGIRWSNIHGKTKEAGCCWGGNLVVMGKGWEGGSISL